MLSKKDRELVDYYKNWKHGMGPFKEKNTEKKKVKHTKKTEKETKATIEIMDEIQFELGLNQKELDDLLIPEEEWDNLE